MSVCVCLFFFRKRMWQSRTKCRRVLLLRLTGAHTQTHTLTHARTHVCFHTWDQGPGSLGCGVNGGGRGSAARLFVLHCAERLNAAAAAAAAVAAAATARHIILSSAVRTRRRLQLPPTCPAAPAFRSLLLLLSPLLLCVLYVLVALLNGKLTT